jgi:glycosyltransferase involved in cell wall biosynthesis
MYLSIVIPLLNEAAALQMLYDGLVATLKEVTGDYEIIFVDDGSTDHSSEIIEKFHQSDSRVKLIQFRKNFGKSAALLAGFREASGEILITIDADLQDDPKEIPKFLQSIEKGYDLVSGWKQKRQDSLSKTIPSKIFNWVVPLVTGVHLHDLNCGFKAYRSEVVKNLRIYGELHRFIPVLAAWRGFRVGEISVEHHPRRLGNSKFGMERYLRGFFDFITVYFLTHYLKRPLHLFGGFGLALLAAGVGISGYFLVQWFIGVPLHLRPIMVLGWVLIVLGVQLMLMGLIGEMITHTDRDRRGVYDIRRKIT